MKLPDINELLDRPIINPNYAMEWAQKMTEKELDEWTTLIKEELYQSGVPDKWPDMNSAILSKTVDRDILYNMIKEEREKIKSQEIFNKCK